MDHDPPNMEQPSSHGKPVSEEAGPPRSPKKSTRAKRRSRGRRKLLVQIFTSFLFITLVFLFLVTWYASVTARAFFMDQTARDLEHAAGLVAYHLRARQSNRTDVDFDETCKVLKDLVDGRITVIDGQGLVVGDSDYPVGSMENHGDRPEFLEARDEGLGTATRFSDTLQQKMMYVAVALDENAARPVIIRVSRPLDEIEKTLRAIQIKIGVAWLVSAILAAFIILNYSRRISRPFEKLINDAQQLAKGVYKPRLPVHSTEEIVGLAETIGLMASRLDEHHLTINRQREELETVLSGMNEAVIAVDLERVILKLNRNAAELFHLDEMESPGQKVQDVIRNREVNLLVDRVFQCEEPVVDELTLYTPEPHVLRTYSTCLKDREGNTGGAVFIFNNITQIKQLESIRRDFVANVSHELRTPITSIKGFVETLQAGAIGNAADAKRFLGIIAKQAERLQAIVDDLLSLSQIEQNRHRIGLELREERLQPILQNVIDICLPKAREKRIGLVLDCAEDLQARVHSSLFEQAIINLTDNAVKYSEPNRAVTLRAFSAGDRVQVDVIDQGTGIPEVYLPRLFERFYRVDRARSRELGGTGLGLSIVKHIVKAHHGDITVQSVLEKGSTFSVQLQPVSNSG